MFSAIKGFVRRILASKGWELVRCPHQLLTHATARLQAPFDFILCHYLVHHPNAFFIEIGAFDGVAGDPLFPYVRQGLLKGCLVEPQPDAFAELKANYAGIDGLQFKNVAVGPHSGPATLYRVKPSHPGPSWIHQTASLRKEVLLSHHNEIPDLPAAITTYDVEMVTFCSLITDLQVEPNIIVIDAEGYDYEIIKQINIPATRPAILHYEHKHLASRDRDECLELLIKAGYSIAVHSEDTTAYCPDGRSCGTKSGREIRPTN